MAGQSSRKPILYSFIRKMTYRPKARLLNCFIGIDKNYYFLFTAKMRFVHVFTLAEIVLRF